MTWNRNLFTRPTPCEPPPSGGSLSGGAIVRVDAPRREGFNVTMRLARSVLALAALALSTGCGAPRIPGTDIQDTADTRAVVAVIDAYRAAAERRDAPAIIALVSTKYFDDAGTPDPADDVDYEQLKRRIAADFTKIAAVRLDIGVKKIDVDGDRADAYVFYDEHYRITTKTGEVGKAASDVHRMRFVREHGVWRFVSGL